MKLNLNPKIKNILWGIFAVVLLAVFAIWMINDPPPEHIADTNGAEDFSLQTITEEDVVTMSMGSRGAISESEIKFNFENLSISNGKKYAANKFTGLHRLYNATILKGSDIYVSLAEFEIHKGNFAFYVVFDGEIVGRVEPGDDVTSEFLLQNVEKTGSLEYIIAGESASFEFIAPIGLD
ncbi:MAG: hypothetical protein E7428_09825 [Ruminococcaceae bacterium]|nr:hypothetical protein [Oscillospiraceae bacterium]